MDISLGLELGIGGGERRSPGSGTISHPQPVLTLSLGGDGGADQSDDAVTAEEGRLRLELAGGSSSPHSSDSPFSCTTYPPAGFAKKEAGELGLEAAEGEKLSSYRGSDEEDDGGVRKKLRLTKEQSAMLENRFKEHSTINPRQKHALAEQLNLRPRQIEVWFQNRRARTKLKQMEVDCEILKKCCQKLGDENRRLQKELQQLKALEATPPQLYTHSPAAENLTVCPSCGRRSIDCVDDGGGHRGGDAAAGHLLAVPVKPYYLCNIRQHVN